MYDAQLAVMLGDEEAWAMLPPMPEDESLRCSGRLVTLVSSVCGELSAVHHMDTLEALPSVARVALEATTPGEHLERTIDLNTCAGTIILLHADRDVVERDYQTVRALQPSLFTVVDEADGVADGGAAVATAAPPVARAAERLRLEADEAIRLVNAVMRIPPPPTSTPNRAAVDADATRTLAVRFPLHDDEAMIVVHASSRAVVEYGERPRQLGDALLRAVRTARDEADALRNCEALVGHGS